MKFLNPFVIEDNWIYIIHIRQDYIACPQYRIKTLWKSRIVTKMLWRPYNCLQWW